MSDAATKTFASDEGPGFTTAETRPDLPDDAALEDAAASGCPFAHAHKAFTPPKARHKKPGLNLKELFEIAQRDILEVYPEKAYSYWMGKLSFGFGDIFTINDLNCAYRVLVERNADYPKSRYMVRMLWPLTRNGVFTSSGDVWKGQREKIDPALGHLHLKKAFPAMQGAIAELEKRLAAHADTGEAIDVEPEFAAATADAIFRVMFSTSLESSLAQSIYASFQVFQRSLTGLSVQDFIKLPSWLPTKYNARRDEARIAAEGIRDVARTMVKTRLAEPQADWPEDMLSVILTGYAADYALADIPVEEVVDQVAVFFLAGHETLASSMTWLVYLIANSPDDEARMRAEVLDVVGADGEITFDKVPRMAFSRAVFREALRLYPPVTSLPRESRIDDKLRSHVIKPGSQCVVSPYFLHRHTIFWREPDAFIPARFTDARLSETERKAYMPFGVGPRICPGAAFATIEAGLMLATLYRRFTFTLDPAHKVEPLGRMTLRPKYGMKMFITSVDHENTTTPKD